MSINTLIKFKAPINNDPLFLKLFRMFSVVFDFCYFINLNEFILLFFIPDEVLQRN